MRVLNSKLHIDTHDPTSGHTHVNRNPEHDSDLQPISNNQESSNTYRYVNTKRRSHKSPTKDDPFTSFPTTHSLHPEDLNQQTHTLHHRLTRTSKAFLISLFHAFDRILKHSALGLAFIGILSFFQLVMSITFISPLNFGLRQSVLRIIRTNHSRPGGREPSGLVPIVILTFIILGLATAIRGVWCFVRDCSRWALRKVEDGVLDVRA